MRGEVCVFAREQVRGLADNNTNEGFFSNFKRGMNGIYQYCGEAHLHRYLAEFDFLYNRRALNRPGIAGGSNS